MNKSTNRPLGRRRLRGGGAASRRRGATLVLIAVMSTALVSFGALIINWSYIELTNTQLRSASDATAKAAVVALSQTQNQSQARTIARQIAREYQVGGRDLILRGSDIEFGNAQRQPNGTIVFNAGVQPLNSARVVAACGGSAATAAVSTMLGNILNPDEFTLSKTATAARYDHDIVMVVDRSASMAWDLSGVDFSYPAEYNNDSTLQNYFKAPHPTESRWAKLEDALGVFRDVIVDRRLNAQVGLVSYASDYTFGLFNSTRVTRDQLLSSNTSDYLTAAAAIGTRPIIGDTNIGAGIDEGRLVLLNASERRMTANRTMILLSDGRRTQGADPVARAARAANSRITVHTISFGDGADLQVMADVALAGGGQHYHASTAQQLTEAFRTIAEQLPAILVQ
ncbi:vWA domain-containing protein [Botrimarina hoheduenensis]|uniref:von Willebrand factor type A domain protein n=1 Tax=Botrimarina hoheduenensis TaxID=2528000 RepID=A0A5C5WDY6_9BACT|nr:vWA domain-containing protein [Botrimarina hoheduenensis]TWT48677.1 von Willebrand factor type A domain protein [Botrimarina hoheduenensis]